MIRLLVAEDDRNLSCLLEENLRLAGYDVELAMDGVAARKIFGMNGADLCILDVMLPGKDGFALAREIREIDPGIPFIFLTAKSALEDKSEGFRTGCDDYLTKPFDMEELLLRLNAILERTRGPRLFRDPDICFGDSLFDPRERVLRVAGTNIDLTAKESLLLHILVNHLGRTVTRSEILTRVWGKDDPYHSKSLDVYLTRLRKYLGMDPKISLVTVHGCGYRLITDAL
jgi:DNA-binding response OmpR family regulator